MDGLFTLITLASRSPFYPVSFPHVLSVDQEESCHNHIWLLFQEQTIVFVHPAFLYASCCCCFSSLCLLCVHHGNVFTDLHASETLCSRPSPCLWCICDSWVLILVRGHCLPPLSRRMNRIHSRTSTDVVSLVEKYLFFPPFLRLRLPLLGGCVQWHLVRATPAWRFLFVADYPSPILPLIADN